jgi:AraC family transcriptional regulator
MTMSLSNNKTGQLWKSFMSRRKEISNKVGIELYSMQVYPPLYYKNFNPVTEFEKWAIAEVTDFNSVPDGMVTTILPSGLYAVFLHKGPASMGVQIFQYIFGTWIPKSEYDLDNRPHFELLGDKYKNEDVDSEEEIWIPIKLKL